MGTKVSYRSTRSGNEAGAEIMDPVEFFNEIFDAEGPEKYKILFDALPADKQAEFHAIFDGSVDFSESATGMMWLAEHDDEHEFLNAQMAKVKALIDSV